MKKTVDDQMPNGPVRRLEVTRSELDFGRHFFEGPFLNRMRGSLAYELSEQLDTSVGALAFRYKDGYMSELEEWQAFQDAKKEGETSLPHSDDRLRVLRCKQKTRLSSTLFGARRPSVDALLKNQIKLKDTVKDHARDRITILLKQLEAFSLADKLYPESPTSEDPLGELSRKVLFLLSEPGVIAPVDLLSYQKDVYRDLEPHAYSQIWQQGDHVLFSRLGFHCQQADSLEAMLEANPLEGMDLRRYA